MLSDRSWAVGWHSCHLDTKLLTGCQVNAVKPSTAHRDHLDTEPGQLLDDLWVFFWEGNDKLQQMSLSLQRCVGVLGGLKVEAEVRGWV